MPSTGMPSSRIAGSSEGAPRAYTDAGPPERIRPRGERRAISATPTSAGTSSEKTPHSRTRRAISCEYWPPKSTTSTSSTPTPAPGSPAGAWVATVSLTRSGADERLARSARRCGGARTGRGGRSARPHPDALVALELLALGLQRRGHHQLGAVELGDVLVAAGRHRRPQPAEQVQRAVVLVRGPDEDLLERRVLPRLHACPARQRRVERRHAPVEAVAGRLQRSRQRRSDHHRIGAADDGLRDVAARAHAAVGDH